MDGIVGSDVINDGILHNPCRTDSISFSIKSRLFLPNFEEFGKYDNDITVRLVLVPKRFEVVRVGQMKGYYQPDRRQCGTLLQEFKKPVLNKEEIERRKNLGVDITYFVVDFKGNVYMTFEDDLVHTNFYFGRNIEGVYVRKDGAPVLISIHDYQRNVHQELASDGEVRDFGKY